MVLLHATAAVLVVGLDLGGLVVTFVVGMFCEVVGVSLMGGVVVFFMVLAGVYNFDFGGDGDSVEEEFVVVSVVDSVILLFSVVLVVVVVVVVSFTAVLVALFFVASHKDCAINSAKRGTSKAVI